jgi:hypothetical protein
MNNTVMQDTDVVAGGNIGYAKGYSGGSGSSALWFIILFLFIILVLAFIHSSSKGAKQDIIGVQAASYANLQHEKLFAEVAHTANRTDALLVAQNTARMENEIACLREKNIELVSQMNFNGLRSETQSLVASLRSEMAAQFTRTNDMIEDVCGHHCHGDNNHGKKSA